MPTNARALKVFLCHAEEDKPKVRRLYRFLVSNGFDAWLDEQNLLPGQEWRVEIPKVVHEADVVVVCISSVSARKEGFVQAEINFALDKAKEKPEGKIYIIPAKLEECVIPDKLSHWQWVDLSKKNGYRKLLGTLNFCAREIHVTLSKIPAQGKPEIGQKKVAEKPKNDFRSKEDLENIHTKRILKIEGGKSSIIVVGDVTNSSLISGNENRINTSESIISSEAKMTVSMRSERLVPDRVLKEWLKLHGLVENPFGDFDIKSYPYYPKGAAWPNRWEAFFDPIPSFALCPTPEDAQALSHLLRKECLLLNGEVEGNGINRRHFPLRISILLDSQPQSPLLVLAHCASRAWVDFLPDNLHEFFEWSQAKQDTLLELLYWSFRSSRTIINLLESSGLEKSPNSSSLVLRIENFSKELSVSSIQNAILFSWLKLRPLPCEFTYLILLLDVLSDTNRLLWFEQLSILIPELAIETKGVVMKAVSSVDFSGQIPLPVTPLNWSDTQLKLSLNFQFDAAMDKTEQKEMGQVVDFRSLFGSNPTIGYFEMEENTTDKFISASRNSLARMLTLGNRLLQYHCENRTKDGVPEKYLYIEDLETILNSA
ncbi:MAG TPA: toll/interleukin-1 receptor domain-containing protein [Anaerolineales bacterium]|nr:toll/interleukin-1 receptor domain-containing protein [Anaerolineales bacterium]